MLSGQPGRGLAVTLLLGVAPVGAGLAAPPVAHWPLDTLADGLTPGSTEAGGARAQGQPVVVPGVVGGCLRFDGEADHLLVPDSPAISFTAATFTVSAWVNAYGLNRGQQMVVAKNAYGAGQREWGMMLDHDNLFRFYLHHGGWQTLASTTTPEPGRWYHLAVAVEDGQATIYVNGRAENSGRLGPAVADTAAPLSIGGVNNGGRPMQFWFGAIDEVRLDARPLSAEEIMTMADHETTPHELPEAPEPFAFWSGGPVPRAADLPQVQGATFHTIKAFEPEVDGYRFLHGVALAWHDGRLYASFGHNQGGENTATEEARWCVSSDAGATWSEVQTIDAGEGDLAVSHGVFLAHAGTLWAFCGSYLNTMERVHTRAYRFDAASATWLPLGVVVEGGFWPMQEPQRMRDGNWIMAGIAVGGRHPAAVAISDGDDLTRWELVVIPPAPGAMWGESGIFLAGDQVFNVARYRAQALALGAVSDDLGRTWTASRPSNLPMAGSKPATGTLSTGQHYLICSSSADGGNRRAPLTIALTQPGETTFSRILAIRGAVHDGGGESHPGAALAYPYAIEHAGRLYVGYSNSGGRGGTERTAWNNNSAELAVIPLAALQ